MLYYQSVNPSFSLYSAEWIIWARKYPKIPHYFDDELMKKLNANKQMKDVWRLPAVQAWEKQEGKHPTQKPLGLLSRIILVSTQKNDVILDSFAGSATTGAGSATTGIAAYLLDRKFVGIEEDEVYLLLAKNRLLAIDKTNKITAKQKIRQQISLI